MRLGLQVWGSEGDVAPFTALAAGLVKAGHEVKLVVTDNLGRDYSGLAQRFGYEIEVVAAPKMPTPAEMQRIWREIIDTRDPLRQIGLILKYGFDPVVEDMYAGAKALCASSDAVVGHFFLFPLAVAAEKAGLPIATLNVVHNCIPSRFMYPAGLPNLGRWWYPFGWALIRLAVNHLFLPRANALRAREGLRKQTDVMNETWAAKRLNLVAVSPNICKRPPDWEDRHQVCGFLAPPAVLYANDLPPGLEEFLNEGPPPVYFTFGSLMPSTLDQQRETVSVWRKALSMVQCRAVLQVPCDDLAVFAAEPGQFLVARAPYLKVFPRCAMIVHHGGSGTTQTTLRAGRPSVIVAHIADQFFWGAELERLGVAGKTLRRKGLKPTALAREIRRVFSDPGMTDRAEEMASLMLHEDGVGAAVELLETRLVKTG
jgi:UDP:flavonoid glycosyltransferase YjiC (YdhE family)